MEPIIHDEEMELVIHEEAQAQEPIQLGCCSYNLYADLTASIIDDAEY